MEPDSNELSSTPDSGSDFDRSKFKPVNKLEIQLQPLCRKPEAIKVLFKVESLSSVATKLDDSRMKFAGKGESKNQVAN